MIKIEIKKEIEEMIIIINIKQIKKAETIENLYLDLFQGINLVLENLKE